MVIFFSCLAVIGLGVAGGIQIWGLGSPRPRHLRIAKTLGLVGIGIGTVGGILATCLTPSSGGPVGSSLTLPAGPSVQYADDTRFERELERVERPQADQARTYFKAGKQDVDKGSFADAARNFAKATEVVPTMSGYLNHAGAAAYISKFDEAENAYREGLVIAEKLKDREFEVAFHNGIGACRFVTGDRGGARTQFEIAENLSTSTDEKAGARIAKHNLGICQAVLGNPWGGANTLRMAIQQCHAASDTRGEARALSDLGLCLARLGDHLGSLQALKDAEKLERQVGDKQGLGRALCSLSKAYCDVDDIENAVRSAERSEEIFRELGDDSGVAAALGNKGIVELRRGKINEADWLQTEALRLYKSVGHIPGQAITLRNLSHVRLMQSRDAEAVTLVRQARELNDQIGDTQLSIDASLLAKLIEDGGGEAIRASYKVKKSPN